MKNVEKYLKFAIFVAFALIFLRNPSSSNAQTLAVNSSNISSQGSNLSVPIDFKVYTIINEMDNSRTIKFDIPYQSNATINIKDERGNIVKSFLYDNINAGNYEISVNNSELTPGKYNIIFTSGDNSQQVDFLIL